MILEFLSSSCHINQNLLKGLYILLFYFYYFFNLCHVGLKHGWVCKKFRATVKVHSVAVRTHDADKT
jgi:hypothetical protein